MICLLVDVFSKDITGKQAEKALENAGIWYGGEQKHHSLGCVFSHLTIWLGTPALTSRGMSEEEMKAIASTICDVLDVIQR